MNHGYKIGLLKIFAVGLVGALIGGFIVGYIAYNNPVDMEKELGIQSDGNSSGIKEKQDVKDDPPTTIEAVAEMVTPTVVGITTVEITHDFFMRRYENTGVGSGFIVTEDGYILTNHHVITENPKTITVSLKDGRELEARKIWSSETLDLAVIKVDANNLPVAVLGDSDNLRVGQLAIAIGNPLGLTFERTVTSGIVSALNRSIVSQTTIAEDLIQTDASINEGNSGGPLLDSKGHVIGINTYKVNSGEGMGFAIPINIAKPIVKQIIENGEFKPTLIGFSGIDRELAKYYPIGQEIELDSGILIVEVQPRSGAEKAGLRKGDIITAIEGIEVNTMLKVREIIYNKLPGDTVHVQYKRDGIENSTQVVLSGEDNLQTLSSETNDNLSDDNN